MGIAFQSLAGSDAENIGYVIPTPVIQHFLTDFRYAKAVQSYRFEWGSCSRAMQLACALPFPRVFAAWIWYHLLAAYYCIACLKTCPRELK